VTDTFDSTEGGMAEPEATPAAQAHADALGVDLTTVEGTGVGGNILKSDVQTAADETAGMAPEPAGETTLLVNPDVVPLSEGFPTDTGAIFTTQNPGVPQTPPSLPDSGIEVQHQILGDGSIATALAPAEDDPTVIDPVEPAKLSSNQRRVNRHILHNGVDYAPGSVIDISDSGAWSEGVVEQLTADGALGE
jgi:pyruvate/2-oxoglutarate dehydrogenase complex dihydrolipoamide acyltransferase (E2) component